MQLDPLKQAQWMERIERYLKAGLALSAVGLVGIIALLFWRCFTSHTWAQGLDWHE